ncbi:unnamed protein product [Aureobasidium uvarum]|uniref:CFEM domain-containing protein n=1 Tax=Aureobasidium uvarum TaxID=2773716 RepID=A0A9N8KVH1_9PEZI|nr:unnamed protein product [Aureobasidium uvarum]
MRTVAIFAAAIAFVAPVLAQSNAASVLSSLPSCGQTCILNGIAATGCSASDSACLCSNTAYQSGVASCVTSSCSAKDAAKVAAAASSLCPSGTGAQAASGSSAAPASSAASAVSSSAVVASSSAATMMASSSAAANTASSSVMMSSSMAGSATSGAASATSSMAVYTGAASNIGAGLGFLALLGVAAAI